MNLFRPIGIIITCILLYINFVGEKIPVNNGQGWDGRLYASYAAHLDESIQQKTINEYRFQRILMSVVLNKSMKALNIEFTVDNTVMAFKVFNLFFLLLALLYYYLISNKLGLSEINEFLGLAGLFWCFPVLKLSGYNPIITDIGAFSIGMMITYHFLCDHKILNLALILLGSFVYPTFFLFGLLVLFPRESYTSESKPFRLERFILPVIYILLFAWAYLGHYDEFSDTYAEVNGTNNKALFISIIIALFYTYLIGAFLPDLNKAGEAVKKINWWYVIPVVGIFVLVKYLTANYATPQPAQMSSGRYLINVMKQSVANPGVFFIAHVIYIGWLPLIMIWMGKEIIATIKENGYGVAILFAGVGLMSLGSETRQLINFYPLLVIIVLIALQKKTSLKPWVVIAFGITSLILSRFWYTINVDGDMSRNLLQGPAQRYFQVFGPWMSDSSYVINLLIVFLAGMTFFILQKSGNLFELSIKKPKLKPATNKKRK